MSRLHRGDENLHYSDNSHRWIAPPGIDQDVWESGVRAHLDEHRVTMGGPPVGDELPRCLPPGVPNLPKRSRRVRRPALRPAVGPVVGKAVGQVVGSRAR